MLNKPRIFFYLQRILSGNYSRVRQVLKDEVRIQQNQTVLDLACGTGNIADFFDAVDYIGIDISQDYVKFAKAQFQKEFLVTDARQLCFSDASFDHVIVIGLFHHLSDTDTLSTMRELSRTLRRSGHIVIVDAIPPVSRLNILGMLSRKLDRGKYFRYIGQYQRLFGKHFVIRRKYQTRWWPFDYCVFVLDQKPV